MLHVRRALREMLATGGDGNKKLKMWKKKKQPKEDVEQQNAVV